MHTRLNGTPTPESFLRRCCGRIYEADYRRLVAMALLVSGGGMLLAAYIGICIHTGSPWPWGLAVHEDGHRTLLGTVLYFEHATRELPLDLLLGAAIGGCALFAFPPARNQIPEDVPYRSFMWLAITVLLVIAITLTGTALRGGLPLIYDNLFQYHTRPGWPLTWGGHWRYHLGSRLVLILVSMGVAGFLRLFIDSKRGLAAGRAGLNIVGLVLVCYALLSVLFADSMSSLLWAFSHPIPLGHQARELLTHGMVTLPLAWGGCLLAVSLANGIASPSGPSGSMPLIFVIAGVAGIVLGAYIGIAALVTGASSHGQSGDLAVLVFPHFFEHSITYLITPLVAVLAYVTVACRNH